MKPQNIKLINFIHSIKFYGVKKAKKFYIYFITIIIIFANNSYHIKAKTYFANIKFIHLYKNFLYTYKEYIAI